MIASLLIPVGYDTKEEPHPIDLGVLLSAHRRGIAVLDVRDVRDLVLQLRIHLHGFLDNHYPNVHVRQA